MQTKPIGSDFLLKSVKFTTRCSECHKKIPANTPALVSIRHGKVQKRVCSEECRLIFDAWFWGFQACKKHPTGDDDFYVRLQD